MKRSIVISSVVLGVMATAGIALATTATETVFHLGKNLFVAGNNVLVSEDVAGDLYAAGSSVRVTGKVDGDLFVGAQYVTVDGDVAGSVRAGASTINVNGSVGKTALLGGQEVNLNAGNGATVKDVMIGGSTVMVARPVSGDLAVGADQFSLQKPVTGAATVKVTTLTAPAEATIAGKVKYYSSQSGDANQVLLEKLAPGRVTYWASDEAVKTHKSSWSATAGLKMLFLLITMIAIGWLGHKFAPKFMEGLIAAQRENYFITLLFGVVFYPLVLILGILMLMTGVLAPLAVIGGLALPLLVTVATVSVYQNVGEIAQRSTKKNVLLSVLIGTFIFAALAFIPFLGAISTFVLVVISGGSLVTYALTVLGAFGKK